MSPEVRAYLPRVIVGILVFLFAFVVEKYPKAKSRWDALSGDTKFAIIVAASFGLPFVPPVLACAGVSVLNIPAACLTAGNAGQTIVDTLAVGFLTLLAATQQHDWGDFMANGKVEIVIKSQPVDDPFDHLDDLLNASKN